MFGDRVPSVKSSLECIVTNFIVLFFLNNTFFCVLTSKHISTDLCKIINTVKKVEAKVGVYMCLLKIRIITIDYCRLMVNNRFNINVNNVKSNCFKTTYYF